MPKTPKSFVVIEMTYTTEKEKIERLQAQGFQVELFNPSGEKFHEKYVAYQHVGPPLGNKIVIIDENGIVVGKQG